MRWNEQEVAQLAQQTPEWEGRLNYRPPAKSRGPFGGGGGGEARDRWFRLRANCLFYFRLSPMGARPPVGNEPIGVLFLERFHVQKEGFESSDLNRSFSIIFSDDPAKKHVFVAETERHARQWEMALRRASYQKMREHLIGLQIRLTNRTGVDPLEGTVFSNNPAFTRRNIPTDLSDGADSDHPKPKPRKNKAMKPTSTFQSHVVQNWENYSPVLNQTAEYSLNNNPSEVESTIKKASFKSHVDVPVANLLDL